MFSQINKARAFFQFWLKNIRQKIFFARVRINFSLFSLISIPSNISSANASAVAKPSARVLTTAFSWKNSQKKKKKKSITTSSSNNKIHPANKQNQFRRKNRHSTNPFTLIKHPSTIAPTAYLPLVHHAVVRARGKTISALFVPNLGAALSSK